MYIYMYAIFVFILHFICIYRSRVCNRRVNGGSILTREDIISRQRYLLIQFFFHCYVGALVAGKNSRDIAVCFFHVATALTAFKYGMCSDQQGIQRCLAQRLEK